MVGRRVRTQRGGAIIGLMIALFIFLLISGLFSFDASRLQMLQRELNSLAESAALAGTSMMASYDTSDDAAPSYAKLTSAQNNGMNYAFNMVMAGNILGSALTSSTCTLSLSYTSFKKPTLGQCNVFIQLMNPTTGTPITVPDPTGRAMRISLAYGYRPVFWPALMSSASVIPILVSSTGGLPQVDTVMVFDLSGSMDDLTVVTMVDRQWDNGTNKMDYIIVAPCSSYTSVTGESTTCLANYVGWNYVNAPTGMVANVLPPQNLDTLGAVPANFQPNCANQLVFDYYTRRYPSANDYGTPPGNCHLIYPTFATIPDTGAGNHFTDVVVNIANPGSPPFAQPLTGTSTFPVTGFTINFNGWGTYTITDPTTGSSVTLNYETNATLRTSYTYNFENLGVLVEAARGNMENAANLAGAFGGLSGSPNDQSYKFPAVHAGYQLAYQQLALLYSQPIATALDGANTGFYQKLEGLADCRYGFVGFSDNTAFGNTAPFTGKHFDSASDTKYNNETGGGTTDLYERAWAPTTDTGKYYNFGAATGATPVATVHIPRQYINATVTQLDAFEYATGTYNTSGTATAWSTTAGTTDGLIQATATGGTDCGEALQTAVSQFNNSGVYEYNKSFSASGSSVDRRAARRAVVFFTDGIPTDQTAGTAPTGNSLSAATTAKSEAITFYTIGLGLNPGLVTPQQKFLDNNTGLCSIALNASNYFPVNSTAEIKSAFSAVVRRLTQGQRQQ